jgi:hypothetical protein
LNRTDITTRETTSFNGDFTFDYQVRNDQLLVGSTLDASTNNLEFSNSMGSVFMNDLAISYTTNEATDTVTAVITGSITDDVVGVITVESGEITISNVSSNTPSVSGTLEVSSQSSYLLITFSDLFSFDLQLDTDNDSIFDDSWQYTLLAEPSPNPSSLVGVWDEYVGGVPSADDAYLEITGNTFSYSDNLGLISAGTYVDTSTNSEGRLQITTTSSINPEFVGTVTYCIYAFDQTGQELTLACNLPDVTMYPVDLIPTADVQVQELVKR